MTVAAGSVRDALSAATDALCAVGVESPRLDAELLLAEATGRERAQLLAGAGDELAPGAGRRFGELVRRRLRREPVAYILGRKGFRHIELAVDRRVLIPRPETEMLVELALEERPRRALDVGTGSGAIALALADELPDCEVTATDTSPEALELARANAERLGLAGRVRIVEGTVPEQGFDLILANLPYISEDDWPTLEPELRDWEPEAAFRAGADGLDAYRGFARLLGESTSARMAAGSRLSMKTVGVEVGEGQAAAVGELLREAGFERIEVRPDLAGIERVVVARR